jgi:riboflavin kinase/FMN adenylyltransferase
MTRSLPMPTPMRVLPGHAELAAATTGRVVAIGNFDGVHLGHQALFAAVRRLADETSGQATVLTFWPHPARVLAPQVAPALITTPRRKRELIAGCGIDLLVEERFDAALAARSPASFVDDILVAGLNATHVCVGYDFTFGKAREGNVALLTALMERHGRQVTVLPPFSVPFVPGPILCSSSFVREEVRAGRPERAALVLSRDMELEGTVVHGAGRGAKIGVPTANLKLDTELVPAQGVYAGWAELLDSDESDPGSERLFRPVISRHPAAINVGYNPTFTEGSPLSVEAHLILSEGDPPLPSLYGRTLRISLRRRLREERRYPGVAELMAQIRLDIEETAALLGPERSRSA